MRIPAVLAAPLAIGLLLAGCASTPKPPPRAVPRPVPAYVPPPPPPLASDWRDWPYTPGDWSYRQDPHGSVAAFGPLGQAPLLTLRCDLTANTMTLARAAAGTAPTQMTVRTSTTLRTLVTQPAGATLAATLDPRDTLLEAMGFSRGRFVIEQPGQPTLVLPAWAEIERVTEDCRR